MTEYNSSESEATVLVVDDDEDLADTYSFWLDADYDVLTAYDGPEALNRYDTDVDVVLLDRRMPGMPGDSVLHKLRQRDADTQVSMLTAVKPGSDVVDLSFDEYLVKPVTRKAVRDTVDELLTRSTLDDELQEFFALCSKRSILRTHEIEAEDTIADLSNRIESKRSTVDDRLRELDDYEVAFRELF